MTADVQGKKKRNYVRHCWTVQGYNRKTKKLERLEDVKSLPALKRAVEQTVKAKLVLVVTETPNPIKM